MYQNGSRFVRFYGSCTLFLRFSKKKLLHLYSSLFFNKLRKIGREDLRIYPLIIISTNERNKLSPYYSCVYSLHFVKLYCKLYFLHYENYIFVYLRNYNLKLLSLRACFFLRECFARFLSHSKSSNWQRYLGPESIALCINFARYVVGNILYANCGAGRFS